MLNITNAVTASRIVLTPLLYVFAFAGSTTGFALTWIIGGASDVLDGYLARRLKQMSNFGNTLDTIADVLYFGSGWLVFVMVPQIRHLWWTFAIVAGLILADGAARLVAGRISLPHTYLSKLSSFVVFISILYMVTVDPAPWLLGVILVLFTASFLEKMSMLWWS